MKSTTSYYVVGNKSTTQLMNMNMFTLLNGQKPYGRCPDFLLLRFFQLLIIGTNFFFLAHYCQNVAIIRKFLLFFI